MDEAFYNLAANSRPTIHALRLYILLWFRAE